MAQVRTITRKEWETMLRHGYASISNGQRFILVLGTDQATTLEAVNVYGLPGQLVMTERGAI